ncbi:MAG TPA: ureidoglycolate lyase [Acidimicrobiia bacterium]|nr:ureidoglycolate lyase [Acidimicrobiia bacterium]
MADPITIDVEPFTPDAWREFGWVPVPDADPSDGIHSLEFGWEDAHLNYISHSPDELERDGDLFVLERLYHHDTHTQALMPLDCLSWIAVAPAFDDFSYRDQVESVRAFRLEPMTCIVLHRGTWHLGPFPIDGEPVRVLNLQGRRYKEDNAYIELDRVAGGRVFVRARERLD